MNRTGEAWPAAIGAPEARQIGDGRRDRREDAARPGRSGAWGGTTTRTASPFPGYGKPVVLSGDDSFVSHAGSVAAVLVHRRRAPTRSGTTRATSGRSSTDGVDDYYDFPLGSSRERVGQVREGAEGRRDRTQARRQRADGGGQGLPGAAEQRHWQRDASGRRRSTARSGCSSTGATRSAARLPVHARRGHRLRQAARHAERRLRRRQRARHGRSGPADGRRRRRSPAARRTAASGSSCSTRATRRR